MLRGEREAITDRDKNTLGGGESEVPSRSPLFHGISRRRWILGYHRGTYYWRGKITRSRLSGGGGFGDPSLSRRIVGTEVSPRPRLTRWLDMTDAPLSPLEEDETTGPACAVSCADGSFTSS